MEVTVAICTWNRAELLDVTLSSLAKLKIPREVIWKVIVADNNSDDGTVKVLAAHESRLPLQHLFVPRQGKSYALNAVIERLDGDLVLWSDDDVLFDDGWLASYVRAAQMNPEVGFFGGPIIPRFLGDEPPWLRPAWNTVVGIFAGVDFGDEPFPLDKQRLPFGANWAVRVPLQKQFGYDLKLGPRGQLVLSGEEIEVMQRMLTNGHRGLWTPQSSVEHLITPERTEIDAIRRYFFGYAESVSTAARRPGTFARLWRGTAHACAALICQALGSRYSPTSRPDLWMKYLMQSNCSWGHVEGHWKEFPAWLKPRAVKQMLKRRHQPRFAEKLEPLLAGLQKYKANQRTQCADTTESARSAA